MGIYMNIYNGTVTAGGTDGTVVSNENMTNPITIETVRTTLTAASTVGTKNLAVATADFFAPGQTLFVDEGELQEVGTIASISGTTVTLTDPLEFAHAANAKVIWMLDCATNQISAPQKLAIRCNDATKVTNAVTKVGPAKTTLSAAASSGATRVSVASILGFEVGSKIIIGTETVTLTTIATGTMDFTPALTSAKESGAAIKLLNGDKWAFALDSNGAPGTFADWGSDIEIPAGINSTNTLFWAKARAVDTEQPGDDTSVKITVICNSLHNE